MLQPSCSVHFQVPHELLTTASPIWTMEKLKSPNCHSISGTSCPPLGWTEPVSEDIWQLRGGKQNLGLTKTSNFSDPQVLSSSLKPGWGSRVPLYKLGPLPTPAPMSGQARVGHPYPDQHPSSSLSSLQPLPINQKPLQPKAPFQPCLPGARLSQLMTPSLQWLQRQGSYQPSWSGGDHSAHNIALRPLRASDIPTYYPCSPSPSLTLSKRVGATSHVAPDTQEAHQWPREGMSLSPGG